MKYFTTEKYGRAVVLHLGKGEKVLESITKACEELNLKNGVLVTAIGSLRKGSLHVIARISDDPLNEYYKIDAPIELGAAQGLILDGEPHIHVNISCFDGKVLSGHLEPDCEIQYLGEFCILELLDMDLTRKLDEFNISYIDYKN